MDLLKRAWAATVWAPNGVAREDWRYRNIYRVVLPLTDLLFVWFGVAGIVQGVASVEKAAGLDWQVTWSAGIAISAFACGVGVCVPRLWPIELVAKIFLVGHVSVYVFVYIARGATDPVATALAGLICILILLPMWRVSDLGNDLAAWLKGRRKR